MIPHKNILESDFINHNTPILKIEDPIIKDSGIKLFIKREDLNHPELSGNKWHKLKYNLITAKEKGFETLLTFGGAYSNHIYATAAAGNLFDFKTIGIIRGEEQQPLNSTLSFATSKGMKIHYVNRKTYREKNSAEFIKQLRGKFGNFYFVPEGGTNKLAVKGASEIISNIDIDFDYVCCACGTGGTLAGLVTVLKGRKKALGFSVLKGGSFLLNDVEKLIYKSVGGKYNNWDINLDFHFGGYAKINSELIEFIKRFQKITSIPIEPIYMGKLLFGVYNLILNHFFSNGMNVLVIHTGGLQGLMGMKNKVSKISDANYGVL
ncbi:MAG: pyridoxal-phosphate dependent enzyme [Ignavibacteriaceae bacterium]|jgi:1-aminocyclopropane-1-carboxylate deaminase